MTTDREDDVSALRVVMLAKGWTGYLDAAFVKLAERGAKLMVVSPTAMDATAFTGHAVDGSAKTQWWDVEPDPAALTEQVRAFAPDAVLVHSWEVAPYRAVLKAMPPRVVRVLWMDNVWLGTPKQFAGRLVSRFYVQPLFDVAMVPSDRTEFFARRLGFGVADVIRGGLSADTDLFSAGPHPGEDLVARRRFLAVLRLVHHKGADVLAEAYQRYRTLVADPWDLGVVGIGPLGAAFTDAPGVQMHGFLPPGAVAALMAQSSCYVNPSRVEPYAVVLHEAAAASLPILSTDMVGASPTMVQDGYNGWVVASSDADSLAHGMARMSTLDAARLGEMSRVSRQLSARLSPSGWARNLEEELLKRMHV